MTSSNTLDWKPKEVTGAVEGLMDKKSGEVHLSVNLPDVCGAEPKKSFTTSALSNTLKAQFWRTPNCLSIRGVNDEREDSSIVNDEREDSSC